MKNITVSKILIVDDHEIVRQGLVQLLKEEPNLDVCGEARDASEAMDKVAALKPDLVLLDISLDDVDGIELTKTLVLNFPGILVLILSMHDESLFGERALRAGAQGYVMKQEGSELIVKAINTILNGDIFLSKKMTTHLLKKSVQKKKLEDVSYVKLLSDREIRVFELIGKGHGTKAISEKLLLGIKTIESYKERIKKN